MQTVCMLMGFLLHGTILREKAKKEKCLDDLQ